MVIIAHCSTLHRSQTQCSYNLKVIIRGPIPGELLLPWALVSWGELLLVEAASSMSLLQPWAHFREKPTSKRAHFYQKPNTSFTHHPSWFG